MAVEKYRSAEEMQAATPATRHGVPFDRFLRHCARYRQLARRTYPHGVFKFRSIEEAQAARQRVTLAQEVQGR